MIFTVTMKDPDTLHDAIVDAVREEVSAMNLDKEETEMLVESRHEKISDVCQKWFKYGEYLCVEIDTDAGTATVVENK